MMRFLTARTSFFCFFHVVFLLNIGFFPHLVAADAWPQYRGLAGDGTSAESIGDVDWTGGTSIQWKVATPLGFSSFSVADGRAYTIVVRKNRSGANAETLVALDAATGTELWHVSLGSSDYKAGGGDAGAKGNKGGDGPRSTPASDGDRVYVYDSYMLLSCFDAQSGKRIWSKDILADFEGRNIKWLNASSPLIDDENVYVSGGGSNQSFLAFDKVTGDLVWKSGDEKATHATPRRATIDGVDQIVFFTQSGLIGVDAGSGDELWRADFPFAVSTAASPLVDGNLVYCSAGYGVGAGLFKLEKNGEQQSAEEVWFKPNELMNHWSTPIIKDGHLYGIYEFKKYGDAPLQCVELATGEIKWSHRGFGPGNCILVGDKLVVLSDDGHVVIVAARPDAYQELARTKAVDGKCWSTPAYSDGRIYVRSTKEGVCIDVNASDEG